MVRRCCIRAASQTCTPTVIRGTPFPRLTAEQPRPQRRVGMRIRIAGSIERTGYHQSPGADTQTCLSCKELTRATMEMEESMGFRVRSNYEDIVAWIQSDPPGVPYPRKRKALQTATCTDNLAPR